MQYKICGKITALVILMSFLTLPVYGEPPTTDMNSSAETGTKYYSDLEIDLLIDDLSEAAKEAIEKAAAEAAKATALASLEREAFLLREAQRWEREYQEVRSRGIRNTVITGVVCFLSGLAIGALITSVHAGY